MKRQMIMASAVAALLSATAGAQQWDGDGYTLRLKGCYAAGEQVRCDLTYTLTQATSFDLRLSVSDFQAVTNEGQTVGSRGVSVGGGRFEDYGYATTTAYKGAPVQVSVLFGVSNITTFKVLAFYKSPINNIPVAKSESALNQRATAPITAPPAITTPAPSAGVPTGFAIKLSNCKVSKGIYTCTATLTPTR